MICNNRNISEVARLHSQVHFCIEETFLFFSCPVLNVNFPRFVNRCVLGFRDNGMSLNIYGFVV